MSQYNNKVVRIGGAKSAYFDVYTTTNLYVEQVFPSNVLTIELVNDSSTDTVNFSFDGATLEGVAKPGENITIHVGTKGSVYVKGTAGGDEVRIWGW